MTQYSVTLTRATVETNVPDGVTPGAVRFQLLNATDNSVVASYDDDAAGLSHEFTDINDESLIPSIEDLDSNKNAIGAAVVAAAFTPSALVAGTTPPVAVTYAATSAISVSAVAQAPAATE